MFAKEERLFIWKKVYEMIDRLEDGHAYFCIIEGMTRRAGAYVPVLVRFWASHKQ